MNQGKSAKTVFTPLSSLARLLVTIAVMSATLIQVLDMTIVNVALPHMQGSFGATPDQVTWILTSYLVASAIFMPLTGYFNDRLGQKTYLLLSIAGFVVASILCGAAHSLTQIVAFRLLQGAFGAALVPLSQAIMASIYPEAERGAAMAIWGMGVMIGPILGPTLGGYLTEVASWRWNFYINVPIGLASFILAAAVVPDSAKKPREMDWVGLLLISVSIGALQYLLDRGNQADWFNAGDIRIAAFLVAVCFPGFLLHSLKERKYPVFDMRLFLDRNFSICGVLLAIFGLGMFGSMILLPLMTENLLNYPVVTTGLIMAPRGISAMLTMQLTGRLISRIDPRKIVFTGVLFAAAGSYIGTFYNLSVSPGWLMAPLLIQGAGLGMIFVPLSVIAFTTLKPEMRAEAAGLFNLLRTLGSSIGISVISTLLARHAQMAWNQLGGFVAPFSPAAAQYLAPLHTGTTSPLGIAVLGLLVARQSQMMAFVDIFAFVTLSFVVMLPLIFLLKRSQQGAGSEALPVVD